MKVNRFEDLEIWKLAREQAKEIKEVTEVGEFKKDFRFVGQITASSGSVMDNIAEGFERGGNKEFIQFLYIAKGSNGEVRSQLYRSLDYKYITKDIFDKLYKKAETLSVKISNLITYLVKSDQKGRKYHGESSK